MFFTTVLSLRKVFMSSVKMFSDATSLTFTLNEKCVLYISNDAQMSMSNQSIQDKIEQIEFSDVLMDNFFGTFGSCTGNYTFDTFTSIIPVSDYTLLSSLVMVFPDMDTDLRNVSTYITSYGSTNYITSLVVCLNAVAIMIDSDSKKQKGDTYDLSQTYGNVFYIPNSEGGIFVVVATRILQSWYLDLVSCDPHKTWPVGTKFFIAKPGHVELSDLGIHTQRSTGLRLADQSDDAEQVADKDGETPKDRVRLDE